MSKLRSVINAPYYGPVGLRAPQELTEVWLDSSGESINVTRNNVVAALRPFTIGIMLPAGRDIGAARLRFIDKSSALLGSIRLRFTRKIALAERDFCLFEMGGCDNCCVSAANRSVYYARSAIRAWLTQRRNAYNFRMTQEDLRCSWVFYTCPRPVYLVSVVHGDSSNIFPMDLVGPTASPWFSMALRLTSPAVRLMRESKRMAVTGVPFEDRAIAYELGKHHAKASIDWSTLPFETRPSRLFGLPVPANGLAVREVTVEHCEEVGSHMLFITTVASETPAPERPQMFHVFSSYRRYADAARTPVKSPPSTPRPLST